MEANEVEDALSNDSEKAMYSTIALCCVERSPGFISLKGAIVLAVVSKVLGPSHETHTADLHIEAMETIPREHKENTVALMLELREVFVASDTAGTNKRRSNRAATEMSAPGNVMFKG